MIRSALIIVAAALSVSIVLFGFMSANVHSVASEVAFFVRATGEVLGNSGNIYREFTRTIAENQNLRAELYSLEYLRKENESLKVALKSQGEVGRKYIPAHIFLGGKLSFTNSITIDKGSRDGIAPGMAVVWGTKTFLGRVNEVSEEYSTVETILSSSLKLSAYVGPQSVPALITGGTDPIFEFIHTDIPIAIGDHVFTASNSDHIPAGLYIGDIRSIQAAESGVFQSGIVGLPYQLHSMYEVFVLK